MHQYTYTCFVGRLINFVKLNAIYSITCLKRPLKKKTIIGFQDRLSLNEGQKYCRMLQGEQSAILSTFIKLPFVIKIFVLSIFECPLKNCFTVYSYSVCLMLNKSCYVMLLLLIIMHCYVMLYS